MGRIERMMLHFCEDRGWTAEDSETRARCILRIPMAKFEYTMPFRYQSLLTRQEIWHCFYKRHPESVRACAAKNRFVAETLAKIDSENAANAIYNLLNESS